MRLHQKFMKINFYLSVVVTSAKFISDFYFLFSNWIFIFSFATSRRKKAENSQSKSEVYGSSHSIYYVNIHQFVISNVRLCWYIFLCSISKVVCCPLGPVWWNLSLSWALYGWTSITMSSASSCLSTSYWVSHVLKSL